MTWLDDVDRDPPKYDLKIKYVKIQPVNHEEYRNVREALNKAGLGHLMIVEPDFFPGPGIWCVRHYKGGRSSTFVGKKVKDIPKAMKMAALWPLREMISRAIVDFWDEVHKRPDPKLRSYSASDIADAIAKRFAESVQQEAEDEFVLSLKGIRPDERDPNADA